MVLCRAYKNERGDYKALRAVKTPGKDGVTWDIERNRRLREIIERIKQEHVQWYETDVGDFRGLPTREHARCIVLAYSPDPTKLRKLANQAREKFDDDDDDDSDDDMDDVKEKEQRASKRTRDSSSSDSSDSEPERKCAKRSPEAEENEGNEKTETAALSFKDKERALRSIESLKGRDPSYQFHAISGLAKRAERVISCTRDEQKIRNMREAVEVLENWITDYNVNGRSKENFGYLAIDVARAFKPLADRYGIEDDGFLK